MDRIHLQYVNESYVKVVADMSVMAELNDHFTYFAENYKFHPKFKMGFWDGKIRLLNMMTGLIYAGLAHKIKKFCDSRGYTFTFDDQLAYDDVSVAEVQKFIKTLNLPADREPREYQVDAVVKCLRSRRRTLLSPTSSGKSLIIYILCMWYNTKQLIIVPTTGLVLQMTSDFESYGYKGTIHKSTDKLNKGLIEEPITIACWQSIDNGKYSVPPAWYSQFKCVIVDEAHTAKATQIIKIVSKMTKCKYRFGTTGTLDDKDLNTATIEGLFGPKYAVTTTKELMNDGHVSKLTIKCIILKHTEKSRKEFKAKGTTYPEEIDFIVGHNRRNQFIKNLALSLKGNKLIFFKLVDKHGKVLYDILKDEAKNVFYIDGAVKAIDREAIRTAIEQEEDAILLASLGTTSTGVSINRLNHMIAASPSKSKIKVLQSIGRLLRLHEDKEATGAILYDIVDDLGTKSSQNYTLKHFAERIKIYDREGFDYKIYVVGMRDE
jgi:superfamily II DNA or RNA helicase